MADILLKCEKARAELETLIDRDVTEYGKASCGMKSFAKGSKELEEVYKSAAEPPLEVCRIAGECIRLCGELAEIGNRNLITDTAIAAIFLEGAFFAGKFNVYINLKYIKDLAYVEKIHGILSPLESEIPALKEAVLERCEDMIGG
jgi:formiminotetrahydrofolate cyclodeaminase